MQPLEYLPGWDQIIPICTLCTLIVSQCEAKSQELKGSWQTASQRASESCESSQWVMRVMRVIMWAMRDRSSKELITWLTHDSWLIKRDRGRTFTPLFNEFSNLCHCFTPFCEPASQRIMRVEPVSHASHASHHVSHARQKFEGTDHVTYPWLMTH